MEDEFLLPVSFNGHSMELPAKLRQFGYTVKIEVDIDGLIVTFEPDEERNWRAVMGYEDVVAGKAGNKKLIEAVAEVITEITK